MTGSGALLRQCPLLLPQNREGTAYEGFVTAQVPEPAPPLGRRPSHRVSLPPHPPRSRSLQGLRWRAAPVSRAGAGWRGGWGGALPASPLCRARSRRVCEAGDAGAGSGGTGRCSRAPRLAPPSCARFPAVCREGAVERRPGRDPAGLRCLCPRNCSFGGAVSLMACGLDSCWRMFWGGRGGGGRFDVPALLA